MTRGKRGDLIKSLIIDSNLLHFPSLLILPTPPLNFTSSQSMEVLQSVVRPSYITITVVFN